MGSTITLEYTDKITPKTTKHLKCDPIPVSFTYDLEVEEAEASIERIIRDEFEKQLSTLINGQLRHLNTWLEEKSDLIDDLSKQIDQVARNGMPTTPAEFAAVESLNAALKKVKGLSPDELKAEFKTIVENWAENVAEQQGIIAAGQAVKKARATAVKGKKARLTKATVLKVVLIVGGIAIGVAATVVSFGAMAVVFGALAATAVSISGVTGLAKSVKAFKETGNYEKRLLGKLQGEIDSLTTALGQVQEARGGLPKYVTELELLIKSRADEVSDAESKLARPRAQLDIYRAELKKLKGNAVVDDAEVAKREKSMSQLGTAMDKVLQDIAQMRKDIGDAEQLLAKLKELGVNLEALKRVSPGSVTANIKERLKTADGWLDLADNLGGLVGAASGF
ncbi:AAA family ATPase [Arenibaculum pallidiluteum]|uniref:hypothetical protein n=1 Tax=Arenibaculum pallidiluteum TaxID=2812559 RepID=UPI001A973F3B|nr:hypothetical protein [Arenibaculum pallidiluteum]